MTRSKTASWTIFSNLVETFSPEIKIGSHGKAPSDTVDEFTNSERMHLGNSIVETFESDIDDE